MVYDGGLVRRRPAMVFALTQYAHRQEGVTAGMNLYCRRHGTRFRDLYEGRKSVSPFMYAIINHATGSVYIGQTRVTRDIVPSSTIVHHGVQ